MGPCPQSRLSECLETAVLPSREVVTGQGDTLTSTSIPRFIPKVRRQRLKPPRALLSNRKSIALQGLHPRSFLEKHLVTPLCSNQLMTSLTPLAILTSICTPALLAGTQAPN